MLEHLLSRVRLPERKKVAPPTSTMNMAESTTLKKQYNTPLRSTIGKQDQADDTKMYPNQNFLQHFRDVDLIQGKRSAQRKALLEAFAASSKTYAETMKFLKEN